jgi:dUTP pyrophosphatase
MTTAIRVSVKRLPHNEDLPLPSYESLSAAGMDLPAAISEDVVLQPGERQLIETGLSIALPLGYEAQIRPRSGLAARNGVTVLNTPGTVDADYRGEVKVILVNLGQEPFTVTRGMRIAQMVIAPVVQAMMEQVDDLPETERGAAGFGSTGTS